MEERNLRMPLTALVLGAVSLALGPVGAPNQVPSVLERFLADNPSLHLLRLADVRDIVEPPVEFSPFVAGDLTGDGLADVAAVVVQPGSPTRFAVVAFNGSRKGFGPGQWIVHLQPERIAGVYVRERRRIDIAYCVECDSNPFVRWDGSEYAESFWLPGDSPETFDRPSKGRTPVALRVSAAESARVIVTLQECTRAEVLDRVAAVVNGRRQVGFVRQDDLTEVSCIG